MSHSQGRVLSLTSLVLINIMAISNLRTLPFAAIFSTRMIGYFAILLIGFLIPIALITAQLATHWPSKGGLYVWVKHALGSRMALIAIWSQWICNVLWYPAMLIFIVGLIKTLLAKLFGWHLLKGSWQIGFFIVIVFGLATLSNLFGMKQSSRVSGISAILGTILPMMILMFMALISWKNLGHHWQWSGISPKLTDLEHTDAISGMFFGLIGIEMSAVHADEVKKPEQTFPKAIGLSVIAIMLSLIGGSMAIASVIPPQELSLMTGVADAIERFVISTHSQSLLAPMTIAMIIGGFGNMATWIIGPSKGLLVAAQDDLMPTWFQQCNRYGVASHILGLQFILVIIMTSLLYWLPVSTLYALLSVMAAQSAVIVYLIMLLAAWCCQNHINHTKPTGFIIPGPRWLPRILILLASAFCLMIFILGYHPPSDVMHHRNAYVWIINIGTILMISSGSCLSYWTCRHKT